MGMMPHPERFVEITQHPNWRRMRPDTIPHGLAIFKNAVDYARQM
jgi:phosphoribosylformylglycinamidine synthase